MKYQIEVSASIPLNLEAATKRSTIKALRRVRGGGHTVVETPARVWEGSSPAAVARELEAELEMEQ